ncbi:DUF2752 domain-containing protein [Propionibacteriaceae bacterium Y1923]
MATHPAAPVLESPALSFSPAHALRRVGMLGAVGLGIGGLYAVTGVGFECGLVKLGIYCPLCGGSRMVASALGGDLGAAFAWNPLLFVGGILLALLSLAWVVELFGGPKLRWPRRWGRITEKRLYWVVGVTAAVFMLVRNVFGSLTIGLP